MSNSDSILVVSQKPDVAIQLQSVRFKHISLVQNAEEAKTKLSITCPSVLVFHNVDVTDVKDVCHFMQYQTNNHQTRVVCRTHDFSDAAPLYRAGADVILPADMDASAFQLQLQKLLHRHSNEKRLHEQSSQASTAAMTAIQSNSELGRVIQFVENSYLIGSQSSLLNELITMLKDLGLNASILSHSAGVEENFVSSQQTQVPILEQELLLSARHRGRIVEFGKRVVFNFQHLSVLVKNMPINDDLEYGRYIDLLPTLLSAADAKFKLIDSESSLYQQANDCLGAFHQLRKTIFELAQNQHCQSEEALSELDSLTQDINLQLPVLGLEDDQERFLQQSLESSIRRISSAFNSSASNTAALLTTVDTIQELSQRLNQVSREFEREFGEKDLFASEFVDQVTSSGVELF